MKKIKIFIACLWIVAILTSIIAVKKICETNRQSLISKKISDSIEVLIAQKEHNKFSDYELRKQHYLKNVLPEQRQWRFSKKDTSYEFIYKD